MIKDPWEETVGLRFVERNVVVGRRLVSGEAIYRPNVRILQHRWRRRCVEFRQIAGRERSSEWFEYEWRDVPLEAEVLPVADAAAAPANPREDIGQEWPGSAPDGDGKHG